MKRRFKLLHLRVLSLYRGVQGSVDGLRRCYLLWFCLLTPHDTAHNQQAAHEKPEVHRQVWQEVGIIHRPMHNGGNHTSGDAEQETLIQIALAQSRREAIQTNQRGCEDTQEPEQGSQPQQASADPEIKKEVVGV